jgi:ankyrin repeat protein
MPVAAGMCASVGSVTINREADNHGSQSWVRVPNELKLMFADYLDVHDINSLARTSRAEKRLLTPYMYRRARDLDSSDWRAFFMQVFEWSDLPCFGEAVESIDLRPYFMRAVDANNLTAVRHFIAVGTSVNTSDPTDDFIPTALHSCVAGGYIEMAQLLIQHGVNVSAVNDSGETPLKHAIGRKSEETWVRLLVDAGADICARTEFGYTILSWATTVGKPSTVQFLLERGAIPTTRGWRGDTLLHDSLRCPANSQSAAKLALLLEAGLNIEATNDFGDTPLHYAAKFCIEDGVFELLLQRGANVDAINIHGSTPLQAFLNCCRRSKSAARHILHHETLPEEGASKGNQACVPGCLFGESDVLVVDLLLSAGADIRASRGSTRSPLDWAAFVLRY